MSELIFEHSHIEENGDIIEMRIWRVPVSDTNPEGIAYSCAYARGGKRLIGYDNENHGKETSNHHKHIKDRIVPYQFVDERRLAEDFAEDIDKIKRGMIR